MMPKGYGLRADGAACAAILVACGFERGRARIMARPLAQVPSGTT